MNQFCQNFHQIIDHLYLSDYAGAYNISFLKNNNITHILVCARELKCRFPESFTYLHLPLDDTPSSDLKSFLEISSNFIEEGIQSGGNVLVHCAMGMSRSPSIVIAYLLTKKDFKFQDAFGFVQKKHSIMHPQPNFTKQLQQFEKKIRKTEQSCACQLF